MSLNPPKDGDLQTWDDSELIPGADATPIAPPPADPRGDPRDDPFARPAEEDFVNQELIGAGSLGRVYVAADQRLGREVAVKELALPRAASLGVARDAEARFLREARVTARLEHPNIVPVYFAGRRWDGTPFYAMKFIKGRSLRAALSGCESPEDRLALLDRLLDVCQAVAFAHARGVIHRDLKPENVMLGRFGETWVVDWGLARVLDEPEAPEAPGGADQPTAAPAAPLTAWTQHSTMAGTVLGTPAYMPPEQAAGETARLDARSDVWSLGAMLYELLSGAPPHGRGEALEVLERAKSQPVPPLPLEAPPELRAICEKALRRDPERRYPMAGELLEDLQAYRAGLQVGVYSYSNRELLQRFWDRQRVPLLIAALGLLVAISVGVAGGLRVLSERDVAIKERARAQSAEAARAESLSQSFADKALALSETDPTAALLYAAHALQLGERPFARGVWAAHASRQRPHLRFARRGDTSGCRDLASSADGETVACAGTGGLLIWDADDPAPRLRVEGSPLFAVALSANGGVLAATGPDALRVYDRDGALLHERAGPDGPSVAISPDGAQIYWVEDHRVHALGAPWEQTERLCGGGVMAGIAASQDALIVGCAAGALWRVDPRTSVAEGYPASPTDDGLHMRSREAHDRGVWSMAMSPDGRMLATGGLINRLFLWDLETEQLIAELPGHDSTLTSVSWSMDGRRVATGSKDGDVRIWDVEGASLAAAQSLFALPNSLVAFHRSGWTTFGRSGVMQDWEMTEATLPPTITLPTGIETLLVTQGGARILAIPGADRDSELHVGHLYDAVTGRALHEITLNQERFMAAATVELPDGRLVVPSYGNVPDPDGGTRGRVSLHSADGERLASHALPFMPDKVLLLNEGRLAVVLGHDGAVAWDLEADTVGPWTLGGKSPVVRTRGRSEADPDELNLFLNTSSVDGLRLVYVQPDGQLMVADAPWTEPPRPLGLQLPGCRAMALSDDGQLAALAAGDGSVHLWHVAADAPGPAVGEAGRQWSALRFSPSAHLLAAGNRENRIWVWDASDGERLAVLEGHNHWVTRLAFQGPERLVSASWDNTVRVWDLSALRTPGPQLVAQAEAETGLRLEGARVTLVGAEP